MRSSLRAARRRDRGGIYVALLIIVAVISLQAAFSLTLGSEADRGAAEAELLAVGEELERALASHAAVGGGRAPRTWEDLLKDPRFPGVRRHLRRIPIDPLTGRAEWGLIRDPDGTIRGIHSLAPGVPAKRHDFRVEHAAFAGAGSYADWVFMAPASRRRPPGATAPPMRL